MLESDPLSAPSDVEDIELPTPCLGTPTGLNALMEDYTLIAPYKFQGLQRSQHCNFDSFNPI